MPIIRLWLTPESVPPPGRGAVRVVHLCLGLQMGGMEKLLVELARHANRQRLDLHFVTMTTKGSAAAQIESLGWPVTSLNQAPGLRPTMIFRITKLLRQLNADIVHTHNTKPLLYGAPAARLAGAIAVIHTRHGQRSAQRGDRRSCLTSRHGGSIGLSRSRMTADA